MWGKELSSGVLSGDVLSGDLYFDAAV